MYPTLREGAREVILPLWLFFDLEPGKIYAFRGPAGELYLKRAVYVYGDWVWFLGDNRAVADWSSGRPESVDSRDFGWVHRSKIFGIRIATLPRVFDGPTSAEESNKAIVPQPSEKEITERRIAVMEEELRQKKEIYWVSGNRIVVGKSEPELIKVNLGSPDKLSDRLIGLEPTDINNGWFCEGNGEVVLNLEGFEGEIVFKPLAFVMTSSAWEARTEEGEKIALSQIGDWLRFLSPKKKVYLTCSVPPDPTIKGCGIDEIVFLEGTKKRVGSFFCFFIFVLI